MKKMLFAINPNAGKGTGGGDFFNAVDRFIKAGFDVETYVTQKAGELPEVLKEKLPYFDEVVVWGGDGTLNEAVNGIVLSESGRTLLGYIPRGTVNDFASSLGIPKKPADASELICTGKPFPCDLGRFNGRYFTYVAAFGAFTQVSYSTSQAKKKVFSRFAYLIDGAASVTSIKPIHARVKSGDEVAEGDFIYGMVSNTKSVGGFKIPGITVDMGDGCFELMLVTMPKNLGEWNKLLSSLISGKMDSPLIKIVKSADVSFDFGESVPWTVDGEFGGSVTHARVEARKGAVNVIVPADFTR